MSEGNEFRYVVDFSETPGRAGPVGEPVPRIARLMALAIRLDGLIRKRHLHDYLEVARRGRVTPARMTQIMKLLDLAPDIQEQLLFLPPLPHLNERNVRPITHRVDWEQQRQLFRQLLDRCESST